MLTKFKILFLKWQIRVLLKKYHLSRNGSGRRKKGNPIDLTTLSSLKEDPISSEYRTSHLRGRFPGQNLGD